LSIQEKHKKRTKLDDTTTYNLVNFLFLGVTVFLILLILFFSFGDKTYYCMHDPSSHYEEHKNVMIKFMASLSRLPYQAEVQES
jgi:hypothetical protein